MQDEQATADKGKTLIILLDQGLGDNIMLTGVMHEVIVDKFSDHNIVLIGTHNALQVFKHYDFIHQAYTINFRKNIFHTIKEFLRLSKSVKSYSEPLFFSYAPASKNMVVGVLISFLWPFRIKREIYNWFIERLLHRDSTINTDDVHDRVRFEVNKKYHSYLFSIINKFPKKFPVEYYDDSEYCKPKIVFNNKDTTKLQYFEHQTIGIQPCAAEHQQKSLHPIQLYADVAYGLSKKHNYHVAIFAANSVENKIANEIQHRLLALGMKKAAVSIVFLQEFMVFCEHISQLNLFICNDSGPMHVAAAVNTPLCIYPAPVKKGVQDHWLPCLSNKRYVVFDRTFLGLPVKSFLRSFYRNFKITPRIKNINDIVKKIIHHIEKNNLL